MFWSLANTVSELLLFYVKEQCSVISSGKNSNNISRTNDRSFDDMMMLSVYTKYLTYHEDSTLIILAY